MTEDFIPLCETLWQDWLADSLTVSPFVEATFDMNAAPEPYVSFNAGATTTYCLNDQSWHDYAAPVAEPWATGKRSAESRDGLRESCADTGTFL